MKTKMVKNLFFLFLILISHSMNAQVISGNCQNGFGTYKYSNGTYSGYWKNGNMHGEGTYTWTAGSIYKGQWVDNERTGCGVYYYEKGDIYEGGFLKGKRNGIGNYYWKSGAAKLGEKYEKGTCIEGTGHYLDSYTHKPRAIVSNKSAQSYSTNYSVDFSKYKGGSYLSKIKKTAYLREGPYTSSSVLKTLTRGNQVFVLSSKGTNGFYPVIDLESNKRGFIFKSYVTLVTYYAPSSKPMFSKSGYSSTYKSKVVVHNNTSKTLSLDLGSKTYSLSPYQKKTIYVSPGNSFYLASAAGVLPSKGTQKFESNSSYSWEFYIRTSSY